MFKYAETWLGKTLGTIITGVSSNFPSVAQPKFFCTSLACFSGRAFIGKMAFVQSAHYIWENAFWWAFPIKMGSDNFLLKAKKGYGSLIGFAVDHIWIINGQIEKINWDFFVPMVGSSSSKIGLDPLIVEVDSPMNILYSCTHSHFWTGTFLTGICTEVSLLIEEST